MAYGYLTIHPSFTPHRTKKLVSNESEKPNEWYLVCIEKWNLQVASVEGETEISIMAKFRADFRIL